MYYALQYLLSLSEYAEIIFSEIQITFSFSSIGNEFTIQIPNESDTNDGIYDG